MKLFLIKAIVMFLSLLTPTMLRTVADMLLDFVEDKVIGSANDMDDAIILPACDLIRATFNIPDND